MNITRASFGEYTSFRRAKNGDFAHVRGKATSLGSRTTCDRLLLNRVVRVMALIRYPVCISHASCFALIGAAGAVMPGGKRADPAAGLRRGHEHVQRSRDSRS